MGRGSLVPWTLDVEKTMFTGEDIVSSVGGRLLAGMPSQEVLGVSIDSRTLKRGDLFVAIRGDRFDGHDYVDEAVRKGASGLLIEYEKAASFARPADLKSPTPLVIGVEDTLQALQELAAAHRRRFEIPVVGVTGSNGKTTTKEMIGAVLRERLAVLTTTGNLNNHIGLPLTLLGLKPGDQAAVLEMGISAPGELRRLSEIAAPTIGVITNVGAAHLQGLKDVDQAAQAKAEILDVLGADGTAVLNRDDPRYTILRDRMKGRVVSVGIRQAADVAAEGIRERYRGDGPQGVSFMLHTAEGVEEVFIPALGRHNVYNALMAAAVGGILGLTPGEIRQGLQRYTPMPLRMAFLRVGSLEILNDAYNANPGSMTAALEVLSALQDEGRGIAVLGDMLELGEYASESHRVLGREAARLGIHYLVVLGTFSEEVAQGAIDGGLAADRIRICRDPVHAVETVRGFFDGRTIVLVKGSRGMRMERIVEGLLALS
jgi:UDP-N-acetylmuramoyl-tripeptide--D-alanyl-D-alanine ligase